MHVVRARRLVGDDGVELRIHPVRWIRRRDDWRIREVVLWQVRQQPPHVVQRLRLIARREMRDAASAGVDGRAAERLRVHLLVRDGLHDVRSGDEHVARPLHHHREVRHGGRVDGAAGARPEDDGDLGHDAGRQDVAQEDLRVPAERRDALLDPRAPGIVEADDRRTDLHRQVHDLADLLRVRLRQRTAEDREVLAEDEHEPPVDRSVSRDDAVAEEVLAIETELRRAVRDERIELHERARVEEQVEALPCRELAPRMLALHPHRASALQGLRTQTLEARDPLGVRWSRPGLPPVMGCRLCAKTLRTTAIIGSHSPRRRQGRRTSKESTREAAQESRSRSM